MVAVPAEASDYEVNTGTRKAKARQKQSSLQDAITQASSFLKQTTGCCYKKTKPFGTPRRTILFFLLTRFIDALQRLAHATIDKGPLTGESAASACSAAAKDSHSPEL
jgi:hypothetical protein